MAICSPPLKLSPGRSFSMGPNEVFLGGFRQEFPHGGSEITVPDVSGGNPGLISMPEKQIILHRYAYWTGVWPIEYVLGGRKKCGECRCGGGKWRCILGH